MFNMLHVSSVDSKPSKTEILRGFITEKLTTAVQEIFAVVERTVAGYEEEASGLRQEIDRQRKQLEVVLQPQVSLCRIDERGLLPVCEAEKEEAGGGEHAADTYCLKDTEEEEEGKHKEEPPRSVGSDQGCLREQNNQTPPRITEEAQSGNKCRTSDSNDEGLTESKTDSYSSNKKRKRSLRGSFSPSPANSATDSEGEANDEREDDGESDWSPAEGDKKKNQTKLNIKKQRSLKRTVSTLDNCQTDVLSNKENPLRGHGPPCDRPLSASPTTDYNTATSGLSRQLTQFAADLNQQLTTANTKLLSMEEKMAALEAKVNSQCPSVEETKRKRRAHNPKIAEAVRRLHNSEANCRRYDPEQGLSSSHNEAVTSSLVKALAASPELHGVDKDAILSACKTYYETVRRNFRYSQPDLAAQAAALKSSARSRQRRKRLLEARRSVLAADEIDFWRGVTIDMMSDEEDGTFEGISGWIVRPPSFRSQELTDLCVTLQARLETNPKYMATHHRRLHTGPHSDRTPPITYDPEAAKRHFKAHMMPQVQL